MQTIVKELWSLLSGKAPHLKYYNPLWSGDVSLVYNTKKNRAATKAVFILKDPRWTGTQKVWSLDRNANKLALSLGLLPAYWVSIPHLSQIQSNLDSHGTITVKFGNYRVDKVKSINDHRLLKAMITKFGCKISLVRDYPLVELADEFSTTYVNKLYRFRELMTKDRTCYLFSNAPLSHTTQEKLYYGGVYSTIHWINNNKVQEPTEVTKEDIKATYWYFNRKPQKWERDTEYQAPKGVKEHTYANECDSEIILDDLKTDVLIRLSVLIDTECDYEQYVQCKYNMDGEPQVIINKEIINYKLSYVEDDEVKDYLLSLQEDTRIRVQ
jgi:hypothetical protein